MSVDSTLILVLAVLFVATVIRSAFGFGEALIAVPLLAFVIPVEVATPLAGLISVTVAVVVVAQDWRQVHVRTAGWLIFFSLFGIPVGLWLLNSADETLIKTVLAVAIIGFASYCLISKVPFELKDDRWAWPFGFLAGVLGGAYAMNGPPLVIYGAMRRWSPEFFRATLQGYFLPASLISMIGFWATGLWTRRVTEYYFVSLPIVVAAIVTGRWLNHRLRGRQFLTYVHIGLLFVGLILLAQTMWSRAQPGAVRVPEMSQILKADEQVKAR